MTQEWMQFAENHWSAEMSTVSAGGEKVVTCPKCEAPVTGVGMKPTKDEDGDISKWEGSHDCGANLLIWND